MGIGSQSSRDGLTDKQTESSLGGNIQLPRGTKERICDWWNRCRKLREVADQWRSSEEGPKIVDKREANW